MSIRIVVYGKEGDGAAYSGLAQVRSLVNEMQLDADIQIVTDEQLIASQGNPELPAVYIDGIFIAQGYIPSRMEVKRALARRLEMLRSSQEAQERLESSD